MIFLGADHRGYELKEKIKSLLLSWGYKYEDMGAHEYNKDDDYPDFAIAVAVRVTTDSDSKGILICGSGIGVAIAANKVRGIRAGTAASVGQIKASVGDENLNVLALASDYISKDEAEKIVKAFLETKFSGAERHVRRVNKIKELEK